MTKTDSGSYRACTWLTFQMHRQVNAVMAQLACSRSAALAYILYRGLAQLTVTNSQLEQTFKYQEAELQQDFPMAYAKHLAMLAAYQELDRDTIDDIPF